MPKVELRLPHFTDRKSCPTFLSMRVDQKVWGWTQTFTGALWVVSRLSFSPLTSAESTWKSHNFIPAWGYGHIPLSSRLRWYPSGPSRDSGLYHYSAVKRNPSSTPGSKETERRLDFLCILAVMSSTLPARVRAAWEKAR